jgi:hypothetical protein
MPLRVLSQQLRSYLKQEAVPVHDSLAYRGWRTGSDPVIGGGQVMDSYQGPGPGRRIIATPAGRLVAIRT